MAAPTGNPDMNDTNNDAIANNNPLILPTLDQSDIPTTIYIDIYLNQYDWGLVPSVTTRTDSPRTNPPKSSEFHQVLFLQTIEYTVPARITPADFKLARSQFIETYINALRGQLDNAEAAVAELLALEDQTSPYDITEADLQREGKID